MSYNEPFVLESSANEFTSHRDVCKDFSVKVVPLDKLDPSVSEYERHFKKVSKRILLEFRQRLSDKKTFVKKH